MIQQQELHIALLQTALIWEDPEQNRLRFSQMISNMAQDVDLIVLPEMFTTGFTMFPQHIAAEEGQKTVAWMLDIAKGKDAAIVGSIPYLENGHYSNRMFFVEPNGKTTHYDKRHTFTLAGEDKVYKAGDKKVILAYKGFKICPLICYDLRFPVWARNVEAYDLLIYVANWPTPRITAWDTLLKARAIENMAYCVGVNRCGKDETGHLYSGHSAVYDTLGECLIFSEKEEVLYATLNKGHILETRNKLKFLEDRDQFNLKW